jgi:hypothetical protein
VSTRRRSGHATASATDICSRKQRHFEQCVRSHLRVPEPEEDGQRTPWPVHESGRIDSLSASSSFSHNTGTPWIGCYETRSGLVCWDTADILPPIAREASDRRPIDRHRAAGHVPGRCFLCIGNPIPSAKGRRGTRPSPGSVRVRLPNCPGQLVRIPLARR